MNDIYEFFFCPMHGVLRPENLPLIGIAYTVVRDNVTAVYLTYRFNQARNNGAF